jgi:uncharacterized RDD family membrane protein YckC
MVPNDGSNSYPLYGFGTIEFGACFRPGFIEFYIGKHSGTTISKRVWGMTIVSYDTI